MHRHSACVNCRGSTSLAYTKAQPDVFKHEHDKWHCWAKDDSHGHLFYFIDTLWIKQYLSNRFWPVSFVGFFCIPKTVLLEDSLYLVKKEPVV